jgi:hypothetical protein
MLVFLVALLFDHEDGSSMLLRNMVDLYRTTRLHIPEDNSINSKSCENIKSSNYRVNSLLPCGLLREAVSSWTIYPGMLG